MQKLLYLLSVTSLFSLDVYQTPPFHACLMISYIGTHTVSYTHLTLPTICSV